ncbi:TolC family protein [Morganella morganii]|nr:TolC family protein [Morganella morganii]QXO82235.1 TolC family protein [Morganella morganii]
MVNKSISDKIVIRFPDELQSSCTMRMDEAFSSPMIRIAESQVSVARKQIELAKSEHYPTISLNPFYEYEIEDRNSNSYSNRNKDKFGVYLNVKAPLYQGGAISSRVRQAEQALYAANNNLENEYTNSRLKISESSSQVENAKLSLQAKLNRATESIRTRDLYMMQYEQLGTRSFTDLISAESEIHQTKMDIINSEYNIASFSVECLYQTGTLAQNFSKF